MKCLARGTFTHLFAVAVVMTTGLAGADDVPQVVVNSVRKVVDDENHNAFTDLCRFRGKYYLTFRSCPDGHGVFASSSIVVLASEDAQDWEQVHTFRVDDRDTRDPHFLVFQDKLFVYSGTWHCRPVVEGRFEFNEHLGYAAWTEDGNTWHGPVMLEGTYGHYIWRAAAHDGKAYLCGRRKREFARTDTRADRDRLTESALLVSDDGLVFKKLGLFQEEYGNETAFVFEDDGAITAVARSGGGRPAQVCRAQPPYEQFTQTDLDRHIGGPLLAKWGERHLVGGRKTLTGKPVTSLYWLLPGDKLHEIAELPSGGDNSYPGFVQLDASRALVSYYSSHEGSGSGKPPAAIYLAELELR